MSLTILRVGNVQLSRDAYSLRQHRRHWFEEIVVGRTNGQIFGRRIIANRMIDATLITAFVVISVSGRIQSGILPLAI